jgi:hypothetical protein
MTPSRDELLRLAEWWESWGTQRLGTADGQMADKTVAAIRELLAQKPVGYLPAYELGRINSGHNGLLRSARFGPSELDGDVAVYAAPVPAVDLEAYKAEAMRLHRQAMTAAILHVTEDADRGSAALQAHLDKLGEK